MKKIIILACLMATFQLLFAQENKTCVDSCEPKLKEFPILFQQQAAEYRALCYQAFNFASLRLDQMVKTKAKKLAIITDLDETILDNSYQQAELIMKNENYTSKSWKEWTDMSAATAVPGAVAFLQKAKQKGVTIFYISNRDTTEIASTLINLQKLKLPNADTNHMLFLANTSSKEARREIVMKKYNVVMLLGDNLNDFLQVFEKKTIAERFAATDSLRNEWGRKFIVLPNGAYGEWESAIYNYERNLKSADKESMRKEKLLDYNDLKEN
jgi:5'-nucleotidase (lipoprotein e(P4) family)